VNGLTVPVHLSVDKLHVMMSAKICIILADIQAQVVVFQQIKKYNVVKPKTFKQHYL
jgi:hypothetical protein